VCGCSLEPCKLALRRRAHAPSSQEHHVGREWASSPSDGPAAAVRAGREIIKRTARSSQIGVGGSSGVKRTMKEDPNVPSEIPTR
jgi:hypothetical protein